MVAFGADQPKNNAANPGKAETERATPDNAATKDTAAYQQEFLNLPLERRTEYSKHFEEAVRLFKDKRIFETLDELTKAELIFKDDPNRLSLLAACQVEFRSFDKAMKALQRAGELLGDDANNSFNIGEIYFVTHKWKEANDVFEKILARVSKNEGKLDATLLRLIEFKVLLCKIKLGKKEEAQVLSEKYDFLDDSPYYYYSKAALCYDKDDLVGAEEWLSRASRIFQNSDLVSPYQDTLIEFGYIKSFYGNDAAAAN